MTLEQLQYSIAAHVRGDTPLSLQNISSIIEVSQNNISANERLHVYAFAYKARLLEVLSEDFAATKDLVGDQDFKDLLEVFIQLMPPSHPNISKLSQKLPQFIKDQKLFPNKPYILDLAWMEWLINESLNEDQRDSSYLELSSNMALTEVSLIPDPSIRWISTSWPVEDYFIDRNPDVFSSQNKIETELAIRRSDHGKTQFERYTHYERSFIRALSGSKTFEQVIHQQADNPEIRNILGKLNAWISSGIVTILPFQKSGK